jgi:hypothetical protein
MPYVDKRAVALNLKKESPDRHYRDVTLRVMDVLLISITVI